MAKEHARSGWSLLNEAEIPCLGHPASTLGLRFGYDVAPWNPIHALRHRHKLALWTIKERVQALEPTTEPPIGFNPARRESL